MSELVSVYAPEAPFDPYLPYSANNYPYVSDQYGFFYHAILEANAQETTTRYRQGPLSEDFRKILHDVQGKLADLDPNFTPEHLVPFSYQSAQIKQELAQTPIGIRHELTAIKEFRYNQTDRLLERKLLSRLAEQHLPPGTLDIPPYCRQGDGWKDERAVQTCANACFRMIFGGITGWTPNEQALAESFIVTHGSPVVEDCHYQKLFRTEVFEEISDKTVNIIEIVGADFSSINLLTTLLRERIPDVQVYAIVSLGSEAIDPHIWHASVLLDTTDEFVICHDPSRAKGSPYRNIPREVFARRWARALNRVQLFVSA